jgi:hypothetical protein
MQPSVLCRDSLELEGAPSFAVCAKGGLLRPHATSSFLSFFRGATTPVRALGLSQSCLRPTMLEGAPSFAVYAKGGLLRSSLSAALLFAFCGTAFPRCARGLLFSETPNYKLPATNSFLEALP